MRPVAVVIVQPKNQLTTSVSQTRQRYEDHRYRLLRLSSSRCDGRLRSPVEGKIVEPELAGCFCDQLPERRIDNKAYDSDTPNQILAMEIGVELISPNRSNHTRKLRIVGPYYATGGEEIGGDFAWMQN
jgi:hypothetical protein